MPDSKQIAGLLGPTMVAMLVSESPLIQPHLYGAQIPPVVYLSGVAMFVAGLAIVRAHNCWVRNWTVLVTLSGWFFLSVGLLRMSQLANISARRLKQVLASSWFSKVACWLSPWSSPTRHMPGERLGTTPGNTSAVKNPSQTP